MSRLRTSTDEGGRRRNDGVAYLGRASTIVAGSPLRSPGIVLLRRDRRVLYLRENLVPATLERTNGVSTKISSSWTRRRVQYAPLTLPILYHLIIIDKFNLGHTFVEASMRLTVEKVPVINAIFYVAIILQYLGEQLSKEIVIRRFFEPQFPYIVEIDRKLLYG